MGFFIFMLYLQHSCKLESFAFSTFLIMFNEVPDCKAFISLSMGVNKGLLYDIESDFHFGWSNKWVYWVYLSVMRRLFVFAKVVLKELEDVEEPLFLLLVGLKITKATGRWRLSNLIGRLSGDPFLLADHSWPMQCGMVSTLLVTQLQFQSAQEKGSIAESESNTHFQHDEGSFQWSDGDDSWRLLGQVFIYASIAGT